MGVNTYADLGLDPSPFVTVALANVSKSTVKNEVDRHGFRTTETSVRVRRARTAHRQGDDDDPPRQASRDLRDESQRGDRKTPGTGLEERRRPDQEPLRRAGRHPD